TPPPGGGSTRAGRSTATRGASAFRRAGERAPPRCRGRSSLAAVPVEIAKHLFGGAHGFPGGDDAPWRERGPEHAVAHHGGELCIGEPFAATFPRRHDLGDDPVAVGHQHGFAPCSEPDVFAESALSDP